MAVQRSRTLILVVAAVAATLAVAPAVRADDPPRPDPVAVVAKDAADAKELAQTALDAAKAASDRAKVAEASAAHHGSLAAVSTQTAADARAIAEKARTTAETAGAKADAATKELQDIRVRFDALDPGAASARTTALVALIVAVIALATGGVALFLALRKRPADAPPAAPIRAPGGGVVPPLPRSGPDATRPGPNSGAGGSAKATGGGGTSKGNTPGGQNPRGVRADAARPRGGVAALAATPEEPAPPENPSDRLVAAATGMPVRIAEILRDAAAQLRTAPQFEGAEHRLIDVIDRLDESVADAEPDVAGRLAEPVAIVLAELERRHGLAPRVQEGDRYEDFRLGEDYIVRRSQPDSSRHGQVVRVERRGFAGRDGRTVRPATIDIAV